MAEDDVGLVAVAHALHVVVRDLQQLKIVQAVVRMRVERGVKDGPRESGARVFEPRTKRLGEPVGVDPALYGRNGQVMTEHRLGLPRIDLKFVVEQYPGDVLSVCYSGNHSFFTSSVSAAMRSLRALSRRV